MTPTQLEELKTELTSTVRVVVNGKIDCINKKLDEYIVEDSKWKVTVDEYMTEMLPVKDGVKVIQLLNKFAKWAGLPALGAIVAYWIIK